jgi:hypothetical protein
MTPPPRVDTFKKASGKFAGSTTSNCEQLVAGAQPLRTTCSDGPCAQVCDMRPGPRVPQVGRQICSADRPADLRPDGKLAGDVRPVRRPSGSMHDPIGRLCVPHRQRGPLVNTAACTSGRTSTPACSSGRRPPRRPQDSSGTRAKVSPRPSRRARSTPSNCPRSAPSTPHGWGTAHRCFSFDAKRLRRDVPRAHPEVVASPRAPRWQREFDVLPSCGVRSGRLRGQGESRSARRDA